VGTDHSVSPGLRKLSHLNNCQLNFTPVRPSAGVGECYKCQDTFDAVVEFSIGSHLPLHLLNDLPPTGGPQTRL